MFNYSEVLKYQGGSLIQPYTGGGGCGDMKIKEQNTQTYT